MTRFEREGLSTAWIGGISPDLVEIGLLEKKRVYRGRRRKTKHQAVNEALAQQVLKLIGEDLWYGKKRKHRTPSLPKIAFGS